MSLIAFAIRTSAVYALRGATLAAGNVANSPVDPLTMAAGMNTPLLAVYCGRNRVEPQGKDILFGDRRVTLDIQAYMPAAVVVPGVAKVSARQDGASLLLDVVSRQVLQALLESQSPWAAIWQQLFVKVHEVSTIPLLLQTEGSNPVRVAATDTEFDLETIAEPGFGVAPQGVWADFTAQMAAEPDLQPFAGFITSLMASPALVGWRQVQVALGLTEDVAADLGITPAVDPDTDPTPPDSEPPLLAEIDLGDGDPVTIDSPEQGVSALQPPAVLP